MVARLWSRHPPRTNDLGWASRTLVSYGVRSYGADLLSTLAEQIDKVVVVGLLNPALMGLYAVAISFSLMLNVLPTAVASVLFPRSSGRNVEEVIKLTGRCARVTLIGNLGAAIAGALLAPWLVGHVFGSDFLGAVPVLQILLLEGVLRGTICVLVQAFMALGKPGLVGLLQGIGLALSLPLLMLLVPPYGLVGAGLALLVATTARLVAVLLCFPLVLSSRPPDLWLNWGDLGALLNRSDLIDR